MKRKIAATAMTLAILGGGLLSAAPANAAPASASSIAAVDKEIKTNKEKLRILKLKVSTDKTVGNASDKKARAFYLASQKDNNASKVANCAANGVYLVLDVVDSPNKKYSESQKTLESKLKYDEKKFKLDTAVYQRSANDKLKLSKSYERDGIVFKHQKTNPVYTYDLRQTCVTGLIKQAKLTLVKYNKSITAKDKVAINSSIKSLQRMEADINSRNLDKVYDLKKQVISADYYAKKEIQSAEKKVKNLETLKKELLAKK